MKLTTTRIVELIVAVSVVVISVASLFVAVEQSRVQRQTLEASVVPVIQYTTGNYDSDRDAWIMSLNFTNTGLGPAELRYVDLSWNGQSVEEPADLLVRCCLPDNIPPEQRPQFLFQAFQNGELSFLFDSIEGRFFAPQESVTYVTFERPDAEQQPIGYAIWTALDDIRHELEIETCYCSVFEDCWSSRFPQQTREPVDMCPVRE